MEEPNHEARLRPAVAPKRQKLNTVGIGKVHEGLASQCNHAQAGSAAYRAGALRRAPLITCVQGSGRAWKEPASRASLLRNPLLATSWDKKMADKAQAAAFREARQASIDARKEKLQARRPAVWPLLLHCQPITECMQEGNHPASSCWRYLLLRHACQSVLTPACLCCRKHGSSGRLRGSVRRRTARSPW